MINKSALSMLLYLVALGLIACLPFIRPPAYVLTLFITIFMYVALAICWNMVGGYAGYLSLGTGAFFGIGAYVTGYVLLQTGSYNVVILGLILGGVLAGFLAILVGYPVLKIRGPYFILVSGLLVMGSKLIFMNMKFMGGPAGFYYPMVTVEIYANRAIFYEAMLALAAISAFIASLVENSRLGIGLFCIGEDEDVAETIKIGTTSLKIKGFCLSASLMAVVGGTWGCFKTHVTPMEAFDLWLSIQVLVMGLLGLGRDWRGPVVGAIIVIILDQILTIFFSAEIARIIFGLLLMFVVLFMPRGIMVYFCRS